MKCRFRPHFSSLVPLSMPSPDTNEGLVLKHKANSAWWELGLYRPVNLALNATPFTLYAGVECHQMWESTCTPCLHVCVCVCMFFLWFTQHWIAARNSQANLSHWIYTHPAVGVDTHP